MLHQHRFISPMMDIILGMRCSFKTRYVYLLIIAGQYLALTFTASNDAIFYLINLAESGGSMIGCIVFGYLCSFLTLKWIFVLSVLPLLVSFGLAWRIEERPPCGQKTFV
jgi:hypothetical protein